MASLEGTEHKSSKDILNELFSTFNASFDENAVEEDTPSVSSKKKKKKAKKSKKRDVSSEGEDEPGPTPKKKHKRDKEKNGIPLQIKKGKEKKGKKRHRSKDKEDDEDVDDLIHKHRKNVRNQFKGLVSNIGDIVIKNDELIKSKSKKREEDIRRAAGGGGGFDVEDGEILEDNNEKNDGFFDQRSKKHKKLKLSASQAYKLDVEEKMLLGFDTNSPEKHGSSKSKSHHRENKIKHHNHIEDKRHSIDINLSSSSLSKGSLHRESRDRRKSGGDNEMPKSEVVRQAPPRSPTPPPAPPPEHRRSYKYDDTNWQRERDQYHQSESYSRRRDKDYDVGNYYEKETTRRSDGRTGFGFATRSYYDDPVDQGDRRSNHHHHHPDDHHDRRRGRSRSPPSRSRSFRRSRSRSPPRWRRSRSRSRERERQRRYPDDIIDKSKLLEIARKNAAKLMRSGCLPSDIFSRDQLIAIRAGGKSVDELTDYCKRLARKDARGDALSDNDSDGEGAQFIHHPFHVKDRPLPQITLNIRNAIPIPVRTPQELAIEGAKLKTVFPVSSGTQHRIKELEWHPVDKDEEEKKAKAAEAASKSLVPLDSPKVNAVSPMVREEQVTENAVALIESMSNPSKEKASTASKPSEEVKPKVPNFDISDVIAIRLKAMRQLSENPNSEEAKQNLEDATQMMKTWADSKALEPQKWTDSKNVEPKFLTQSELTQGPQAWAKRDQLTNAKEVQSPMGLHLLQKMGWRPGEGLGKTKTGDTEPLALEVKTDKKGLTSVLDYKKGPPMPIVFDLGGKHPISSLMEICAKRKWGAPDFDLVFEHGPPHKKQFVYKVVVNGVEYQPCIAVNNKKLAKANAAAFCLQSLGLLPTSQQPQSTETLQTVPPNPKPVPPPSYSGSSELGRFSAAHYLQTVPTTNVPSSQPPLPSELMPPPPPPPPLKK